jgi:hypothetical protein
MKKTITKIAFAISLATTIISNAQTTVTFDTFTLSPNSYYQDNAGTDFTSNGVTFQYSWNTSWGGWESGSAYTNKVDTVNGSYTNLYGCIPGTAFSGNNYATVQDRAIITFSNSATGVSGFYITNTTYAWKEIKNGGLGRKFGDTTGTGSGTSITQGQYPDWFKVLVTGYRSGNLLTDSVEFYLADYRPTGTGSDYVVKNWQFVNCASLGQVDSIQFIMKSSDNNSYGMKTPAFFSIDNFTTNYSVGINELTSISNISIYPNPTSDNIYINYSTSKENNITATIGDVTGEQIINLKKQNIIGQNTIKLETSTLESGIYFVELNDGTSSKKLKFIKL